MTKVVEIASGGNSMLASGLGLLEPANQSVSKNSVVSLQMVPSGHQHSEGTFDAACYIQKITGLRGA